MKKIISLFILLLLILTGCKDKQLEKIELDMDNNITTQEVISYNLDSEDVQNSELVGFYEYTIFLSSIADNGLKVESYNFYNDLNLLFELDGYNFYDFFNYDKGIIVLGAKTENKSLNFDIYKLEYETLHFQHIYEGKSDRIPYVFTSSNLLFLNYSYYNEENISSYIKYLDLENNSINEVDKRYYIVNEAGIGSGENILFAGGDDNFIYYQVLEMNNEMLELAKNKKIIKYNVKENQKENYLDEDKIALFLFGNEYFFVKSDYDYKVPLENSGYIYFDNNKVVVPNVKSGNDIINGKSIENDKLFLNTNSEYYFYDLSSGKYYNKKYKGNLVYIRNGVVFLDDNGYVYKSTIKNLNDTFNEEQVLLYSKDEKDDIERFIIEKYMNDIDDSISSIEIVGISISSDYEDIYLRTNINPDSYSDLYTVDITYILKYKQEALENNWVIVKPTGLNNNTIIIGRNKENKFDVLGGVVNGG